MRSSPTCQLALKPDVVEARQRLDAFWNNAPVDRPALHITVRNPGFSAPAWGGPADAKERDWLPQWQAHRAHQVGSRRYLAEAMPLASVDFGSCLALVPVLLGADYMYENGTAWIKPLADAYERPLPVFDPAHPLLAILATGMEQASAVLAGQGALNPPAFGLDPLTILSLLRGAEQLCLDLVEEPERVEAWLAAANRVYLAAHAHLHAKAQALGHHGSASWLHTWAPGSFEALQCDAAVMLSKGMFARFALPALRAQDEQLDYSLYHLDGVCQLRFLDQLRSLPRLRGIQWNPEPPANHIEDPRWLAEFKRIRDLGFILQFNAWESRSVEQVVAVVKALGPRGLMFALPTFERREDAEAAIRSISAACR